MPLTPQEFYDRCVEHAEAHGGRLPLPPASDWDIFPFELDGLRTRELLPPVVPEPPRGGEGGVDCHRCADPDRGAVWSNERWVLTGFDEPLGIPFSAVLMPKRHLDFGDLDDAMAAELGVLSVRIERAARALGNLGRVHVHKWGDGGAHLHLIFLARPEGLLQLRGSNLPLWEEMLPRMPQDVVDSDLRSVAAALAEHDGSAH